MNADGVPNTASADPVLVTAFGSPPPTALAELPAALAETALAPELIDDVEVEAIRDMEIVEGGDPLDEAEEDEAVVELDPLEVMLNWLL